MQRTLLLCFTIQGVEKPIPCCSDGARGGGKQVQTILGWFFFRYRQIKKCWHMTTEYILLIFQSILIRFVIKLYLRKATTKL